MWSVMKLRMAFALALVALVPLTMWLTGVQPPGQSPPASPPLPPIVQVQSMSELATTRVRIADGLDGENENWRVKWALHGEVVLGVDLSQAQYAEVSAGNRTATLSLPLPHLISSKVDHERSTELHARSKWWIPVPPDGPPGLQSLRDEVWKHGDVKIQQLGQQEGYKQTTRVNTERVLNGLFEPLGWKVKYQWGARPR
jgi:hypothetical protein